MTIPTSESTKFVDVPNVSDNGSSKPGWAASLELEFESRQGLTRMTHSHHRGPLRVQRAFQETDGSCHVYMLHPPGGVVAGDELVINIVAKAGTHAVLTTPAAGKFYRVLANKQPQTQKNILLVKSAGLMEWLPGWKHTFNLKGLRNLSVGKLIAWVDEPPVKYLMQDRYDRN